MAEITVGVIPYNYSFAFGGIFLQTGRYDNVRAIDFLVCISDRLMQFFKKVCIPSALSRSPKNRGFYFMSQAHDIGRG